jgi:hypothetical protein
MVSNSADVSRSFDENFPNAALNTINKKMMKMTLDSGWINVGCV